MCARARACVCVCVCLHGCKFVCIPCAHCRALDTPAAGLRSSLRSTRDTARFRPAALRRSRSCRRAHSTLHGTGWPRAHAQRPGVYARAARACQVNRWRARAHSRTFGGRGRRAGFGHHGRAWHDAICPPCADFAEDGLAASQLNFTTGDARRILGCHLGAAYDADRGQRHENRRAAPAANKRPVRSNVRKPVDLRRSRCSVNRWGRARKRWPHELYTVNRQRAEGYRKIVTALEFGATRNAWVRNAGAFPQSSDACIRNGVSAKPALEYCWHQIVAGRAALARILVPSPVIHSR